MEPFIVNGIAFSFWMVILVLILSCMIVAVLIALGWLLRWLIDTYKPLAPKPPVTPVSQQFDPNGSFAHLLRERDGSL